MCITKWRYKRKGNGKMFQLWKDSMVLWWEYSVIYFFACTMDLTLLALIIPQFSCSKIYFFFQNYLKEILSIGVYILSLWDLSQQAVTDWHFDISESQVSTRYWMVAFWRMLPHYITERRESLWLASAYQKYEVIYFVVMIKYGDWRKK